MELVTAVPTMQNPGSAVPYPTRLMPIATNGAIFCPATVGPT